MPETWFDWKSGPCPAALNMAWDEVLLENVAPLGAPILRTYSWAESAATFGYFQPYEKVAAWTSLRPLIRRTTGGGLVGHDADWTYSMAIPPGHWWYEMKAAASYEYMHQWLKHSFARIGVTTDLAPDCDPASPGRCFIGAEKSDLLFQGRKIAGAAQRRNKLGLLIQGSIQPIQSGWIRNDWEAAFREVGNEIHHVEWAKFDPNVHESRALALAEEAYTQDSYNKKR